VVLPYKWPSPTPISDSEDEDDKDIILLDGPPEASSSTPRKRPKSETVPPVYAFDSSPASSISSQPSSQSQFTSQSGTSSVKSATVNLLRVMDTASQPLWGLLKPIVLRILDGSIDMEDLASFIGQLYQVWLTLIRFVDPKRVM
jgi:hypothetical protein